MKYISRIASLIALSGLLLPSIAFADVNVRSCCVLTEGNSVSACIQFSDILPGDPTADQQTAVRQAQQYKCQDVPYTYADRSSNTARYIINDAQNSGVCGTALSASCGAQSGANITRYNARATCTSDANCLFTLGGSARYTCEDGFCRVNSGLTCTGVAGSPANCMNGLLCNEGSNGRVCSSPSAPSTPTGTAVSEDTAVPFTPIVPVLGVPIPGFEFTPATDEGTVIAVPYLSQYINAIYRYMTAIVLTIAIVMVVYGGFRYLLAATPFAAKDGKTIIADALIGMALVLGSYVILNTVNPNLTSLKTLRLTTVDEIEFLLSIQSSTVDWEEGEAEPSSGGGSAQGSASAPPAPLANCPISLTNPIATSPYRPRDARVTEFMSRVAPMISSSGVREKIVTSAQLAVSCEMHMGSCLNAGRTIYEMAGIVGTNGNQLVSVGASNIRELMTINQNCAQNHPGDNDCKRQARDQFFQLMQSRIAGWPNDWVARLQPGDFVNIYTAHSGGAGPHTVIFLGWDGPGKARVFNGQYGKNVKYSSFCLTSECRGTRYPITYIWTPD